MRNVALFLFLCDCLYGQRASIAGIAIDAITRQPLRGVHITLTALRTFGDPIETYGATSGDDGRFSIPNLEPAIYSFSARRAGFFYLQDDKREPRDRRMTLKAGDAIADHTVEMTPVAVITGHVMDDDGDPVENAYVRADPVGGNTPISFVVDRMYSSTDDRGEFRIVGAPGKFYLSATKAGAQIALREIRSDGTEIPVYAQTWHPASESHAKAVAVEAVAGRETAGIDIRLVRKRSFTISGVVTGIPDGAGRVEVFASTRSHGMPPASTDANGRFAFSGLAPDHYRVTARTVAAGQQLISRTVEVPLENTDDTSLSLRLDPGGELAGNLEIKGTPTIPALAQKWTVKLEALTPLHDIATNGGEVDRTGQFSIAPVYPGKFRVHVEPMPENAFVKTVLVDGDAAAGTVIDLSRGIEGSKMKITIGLNGGQVEGTVSSDTGKPTCCILIALVATLDDIGRDTMKSVAAGDKYRFAGLRPGKYRFIVSNSTQAFGTQTAEELFPVAPEIEIHEGDRITRDVKIVAADKTHERP
jgi:hypothetical protein